MERLSRSTGLITFAAVTSLAIPTIAHAEDQTSTDATVDAGELRRGWHMGASVGGAYLPAGGGVAAGVLRVDFNKGGGGAFESRISPILYVASSPDQDTFGVGTLLEERIAIGDTYAFGLGVLFAFEATSEGSTPAVGFVATPITLRLGARHDYELGLNALVIRELSLDNQNYGGYVSFGHLWL